MKVLALSWAALLLGLFVAAPASAEFREIQGQATYDQRLALSPEAVMEVQLLELPGGEAAAIPIASVSVRIFGAKPYPFRMFYDEGMVDRSRHYALAARIRLGEETLFRTAEAVPMFAAGAAAEPLLIRMVPAEPAGPSPQLGLELTEWRAVELPGGELSGSAQAELRFGEENRATGTGGCNEFHSSYRVDQPTGLSFGKMSVTLRGCSGAVAQQERLVMRALSRTAQYRIDDEGALVLLDAEGAEVLKLARTDN